MAHMTDIPDRVRERFWSRVAVRSEDECWPFHMSLGSHGYGQIGWWDGGKNTMLLAHRVAYLLTHGEIPGDLTVDHICRNRRCCNPSHLRLLTNVENSRLNGNGVKTHCKAGHPFDAQNTRVNSKGHRRCLACDRIAAKKRVA